MKRMLLIWIAKIVFLFSKSFNLGAGGTWPGHILLENDAQIFPYFLKQLRKGMILVAGTNGKTTTAKMIYEILTLNQEQRTKNKIIINGSGANLLNGMVSAMAEKSSWLGKINANWAVLETDEATLPQILKQVQNDELKGKRLIIVLLNLFRDQLDRYGEVNLISDRWLGSLKELKSLRETTIIINADDPQLGWLGINLRGMVKYFGLEEKNLFLTKMQHAADSAFCPKCGNKLSYDGIFFSHLGVWECQKCGLRRPKVDLSNWSNWTNLAGVYNRYNFLAGVLVAKEAGVGEKEIKKGLENFQPAFGRQEEFDINGKKIKIFLSKNPTGFNESLRTIKELNAKNLLLVLNDRIPDGRDVSWIWDVDFEDLANWPNLTNLIASGERADDMGLRLKYAGIVGFGVFGEIGEAIKINLEKTAKTETLYILATYSAMLEARKILTGRKLL